MKKWLFALIAVPALLVGCGEKRRGFTGARSSTNTGS